MPCSCEKTKRKEIFIPPFIRLGLTVSLGATGAAETAQARHLARDFQDKLDQASTTDGLESLQPSTTHKLPSGSCSGLDDCQTVRDLHYVGKGMLFLC